MNKDMKLSMGFLILVVAFSVIFMAGVREYRKLEAQNETLQSQIQADSGRVWKGEYTIFNYTQNGWTNRLYVTEFYIEDDTIYYKLRDHKEYLPVKFDNCLPAVGWVEEIDKLMKYGFWQPGGGYEY